MFYLQFFLHGSAVPDVNAAWRGVDRSEERFQAVVMPPIPVNTRGFHRVRIILVTEPGFCRRMTPASNRLDQAIPPTTNPVSESGRVRLYA